MAVRPHPFDASAPRAQNPAMTRGSVARRTRRPVSSPALALLAAALLPSCGPGVTLTRAVPAPYNLGSIRTIALVDARGEDDLVDRFVETLLREERSRGFYEVLDARSLGLRVSDVARDRRRADDLLGRVVADVYFEVRLWSCSVHERSKAYKEKQKDGTEVAKTKWWYEAECAASVEMVSRGGRELASFEVTGTHESVKGEKTSSWQRESCLSSAVDEAAHLAVAQFTPRRVEESIGLEKDAPLAKEGIALVEEGRTAEARTLWEGALAANGGNAGLHYNLGAVCEALGDVDAARKEYREAIRLAPGKEEYRAALSTLEARQRDAEALRRRR